MLECVRVTAHLLHGVSYVPGEVLSLDGPLLYAVMLERLGPDFASCPPSKAELARLTSAPDPQIPLGVYRAQDVWVYTVGGAELAAHHGRSLTHWNKRVDDGALVVAIEDGIVHLERNTAINIASAQYKSYHMPIYDELVDYVHWYALSTDIDELRRLLLTHVHHIGKKRNAGHGAVTSWEVVGVDVPHDRWMRLPSGELTRPLPTALFPDYRGPTELARVRPPYWLGPEVECVLTAPLYPQAAAR